MTRRYSSLALIVVVGSLGGSAADAAGPSPNLTVRAAGTAAAIAVDRANSNRLAREPEIPTRALRAGNKSVKSVRE